MTNTRRMLFGALAAATLLTAAGASLAQSQGLDDRRGPSAGANGRGLQGPERRAEALRTRLAITPAQETAFQAYIAATAGQPRAERTPQQGLTAPQKLDAALAEAARRQTDMKARADAAKRFYAALTPAQRTTFDLLPPRVVLGDGGGRERGARMAMRGGERGERFGREHRRDGRGRGHGLRDAPQAAPQQQ